MNPGDRGLLLLGCGKMGGAMLRGWLASGLNPASVTVLDPNPSEWLQGLVADGIHLNKLPSEPPSVAVIATKPQTMADAIPGLKDYGNGPTLFVSIAAGTLISMFEGMLGDKTPIVRTMPNTPAAIGCGITGLVANAHVSADQMTIATELMAAVGDTVILENEEQIHAVTGLSGSGPAYVFAMTEALTAAGTEAGLPAEIAAKLAIAMVAGSGQLMVKTGEDPAELRRQVTSPNGTTAAGLAELMVVPGGIFELMGKTVNAARDRSIALANGED